MNATGEMVLYFAGRPVTELTREELIAALEYVHSQLQEERERHMATVDILGARL